MKWNFLNRDGQVIQIHRAQILDLLRHAANHADTDIYAKWIPDLKITKGDGGTAHYGSTYPFTLNYYYPDYNSNKDQFDVYVARSGSNYAVLNRDHYAVTQDSDNRVVVTLKASYIRTLADGATYYILFDTGLPDPPTDLGETEGNFKDSKSPKTGDESNVGHRGHLQGQQETADGR